MTPGAEPPRKLDVLVLDDNAGMREVLVVALGSLGHRVICCSSIKEAGNLLQTFVFDLLICDLSLPDGSGLDVARYVPPGTKVHKVILSGYGDPIDVERSLAAGFDAHLVKPLDMAILQRVVWELTGQTL